MKFKKKAFSKVKNAATKRFLAVFRIQGLRKMIKAKKFLKRLILRRTIIKIQVFIQYYYFFNFCIF